MKTTLNDVLSFITNAPLTQANRNDIVRALNTRSRMDQMRAAGSLAVGHTVEFRSKMGLTVRGTVTKVNRTTVNVTLSDGRLWKVSPSLLTVV